MNDPVLVKLQLLESGLGRLLAKQQLGRCTCDFCPAKEFIESCEKRGQPSTVFVKYAALRWRSPTGYLQLVIYLVRCTVTNGPNTEERKGGRGTDIMYSQ